MKLTIVEGGNTYTREATAEEIKALVKMGAPLDEGEKAPKDPAPEACDDDDDDAKKKGARLVETPHAKPVAAKVPEEAKAPHVPSPVPPPATKK